jgi:hypothetical protein
MVPADQPKDRRDIDEFGNEIKTEEEDFNYSNFKPLQTS